MRLTDYIVNAVEAHMQQQMTKIAIPDELDFSDLRLARDPDGGVSFDLDVIKRICEASNVPVEMITNAPEDNASKLIVGWYHAHIQQGGEPDPVAEDLIGEIMAEDAAGQNFSLPGGRA